jgi:outer membrane lipoprotein-sorting protein
MKRTIVLVLALFSIIGIAYAQWSVKSVQSDLEKTYGDLNSISFDFENLIDGQSGSVLAVRGNKYIMKFMEFEVTCNGETVWNYNAQENRVLIGDFDEDDTQNSLERMFFSFMNDYKVESVSKINSSDGRSELEILLSPAGENEDLNDFYIWCDANNYHLRKMEVVDGPIAGEWAIKNLKLNKKISEKLFDYQAPDSAKVIDLRD